MIDREFSVGDTANERRPLRLREDERCSGSVLRVANADELAGIGDFDAVRTVGRERRRMPLCVLKDRVRRLGRDFHSTIRTARADRARLVRPPFPASFDCYLQASASRSRPRSNGTELGRSLVGESCRLATARRVAVVHVFETPCGSVVGSGFMRDAQAMGLTNVRASERNRACFNHLT